MSLREFYAPHYTQTDPAEGERLGNWRAIGAASKAAHVAALYPTGGAVVEIGCGDGALLAALSQRGIGSRLDGFEISPEAIELARQKAMPRVERLEAYDGVRIPASDDAYDLAVLSHVVEHIPEPLPVLREARRLAPRVIVEVPLEANRSARRPSVRAEAARIGHVHAFDRRAVRELCARAGLEVVAELTDPLPLRHHAFFASGAAARGKAALKTFVRRTAFRASPLRAERLFTVHYACLAARG
ncbi:MAG TPA: class I SAM-dependent methyltransferase [Solirubrobacter sp.]|nr:class I SAM-dependent methyltransferase [Solirubrobacter sp.]